MTECKTLASGSTGNSVFFRTGESAFLIDAGISMRKIEHLLRLCDSSLAKTEGIFVTHEHSDHVKALGMIAKHTQIPIYATLPTAKEIYTSLRLKNKTDEAEAFHRNARVITPGLCYSVGDLTISPFEIPHDSAACVGYVVTDANGEKLMGYGADMGHVTESVEEALTGCPRLILESNHDLQMLEDSSYPAFLKERIRSEYGHLSNPDCASFLTRLVAKGTKHVTLFHLSRENNLPQLAMETSIGALTAAGATENRDFTLRVALIEGLTEVCR